MALKYFLALFNFKGRINRAAFFGGCVFTTLLGYPASLAENTENLFVILAVVALVLAIFMLFASLAVKRAHDIGKSGWLVLLWFVPGLNIFFGLYLLFKLGETGPNQYGLDPLGPDGIMTSATNLNAPHRPRQSNHRS